MAGGGDFGGFFGFGLAADFDDEVEEVGEAVAIVQVDDVIGDVVVFFALVGVGDVEAETLVFDVAADGGEGLEDLGDLGFPGGIEDDVGDVVFVGVGLVDVAGGVEVDVAGGADFVVGAEAREETLFAGSGGDDGLVDAGGGFDLVEEEAALTAGALPVFEEAAGGVGDGEVAALTPEGDALADFVDEGVLFEAVGGPAFALEGGLFGEFDFGFGDGDEVFALPAAGEDFVGDAFVGEAEVTLGFDEGGVDDGVLDEDGVHEVNLV